MIRICCGAAAACAVQGPGCSQRAPRLSSQLTASDKAENTSASLLRLPQSILAAARTHDSEMEIPNHRAWLASVYGQKKGEELADWYANQLRKNEEESSPDEYVETRAKRVDNPPQDSILPHRLCPTGIPVLSS